MSGSHNHFMLIFLFITIETKIEIKTIFTFIFQIFYNVNLTSLTFIVFSFLNLTLKSKLPELFGSIIISIL